MKTLLALVLLLPVPVLAQQTYHLSVTLNGVTYQGNFTWTANTVPDMNGSPEPGPGVYTNVSISDPVGTLTSAYDVFEGADYNINNHDLWFLNSENMPMSVNIPDIGMGAQSVTVTGVLVYTSPTAYVSCAPCQATLTEVPSANQVSIPMGTQIVDSQFNLWTMVNGQAVKNGIATPSAGVIMLLYSNGVVYQENFHHSWWKWVNNAWVTDTSTHTPYSCPKT